MIIKDKMQINDVIGSNQRHSSFWAKTDILVGYGIHKDNRGISQLDEVVFRTENMVPLSGVQYAMEQIFGIKGSINTGYLNDTHGIGAQTVISTPTGVSDYPVGHCVCLFGVGTGGAAENNSTVLDVKYHERDIKDMVPFRYTNDPLSGVDLNKYYGKKEVDGVTAYYLKRFDTEPVVRHLWKDGEEGEDGSDVDSTVFDTPREGVLIESFTEVLLTIGKKDIKQWFKLNGGIEKSRINSVGLFTGVYNADEDDYEKIKLFSKLNIPTEPLSLSKDLNIIYRVYGS